MKISFLTHWLPPRIDGVGDYTWNLAYALRQHGIDARIFTSEEQGSSSGLETNDWVFHVIKEWQPKVIIEALKSAVTDSPDWFCLQYVPQMYGRKGICWQVADIIRALKKEFNCKAAVTFHEFISNFGILPKDVFLAGITRLQTKRILSAIDFGITTCNRYKEILQQLARRSLPVTVIPVGANIEPTLIAPEELAARRNRIFPQAAKIFGLFSRLCPDRNFPFAIRAFERARKQGLNAWLYLMGRVESYNPKLFKELMQLADKLKVKPQIVASGELPKEELSIHLRFIDVFIFPQIDGVSTRNTALMAAMAHGLPVVSFKPKAGNFDNFYIPCGVLVDRGDEEGFVQVAVECLKNSDNLKESGGANSDYYNKNFAWPVIAKEYIKALKG